MSLYLSFSQLYITCLLRVKPVGAEPMSRACSFIDNRFVASHVLLKTTNLLKLVRAFLNVNKLTMASTPVTGFCLVMKCD